MSKRILIFSTAYFPHVGGAEVAIDEITKRLAGAYEFDLICARRERTLPNMEKIGAVTVHRIGIGVSALDKLMLPFFGALKALSLPRPNAYWAMMVTYGSGAAYIANLLRWWRPVPIVLTLQEGDSPHHIRTKFFGLIGFSWRLALMGAKRVTVISTYLGALAGTFGYRGTVELVPNAVDTTHFAKACTDEEKTQARGHYAKKEGEVWLTTVSRLVYKNAVDTVIRAVPLFPPSVVFIIAGAGPDELTLRALARELRVEERVRFLGHVDQKDLPGLLAISDMFVRPSRSEGMGISFIEAMAAGVPVIATQEGGITDFLFDEKRNPNVETTGFAVDVDVPEQIAACVQDMLTYKGKVWTVAQTAKRLVLETYDWDIVAPKMQAVFDRVLAKR